MNYTEEVLPDREAWLERRHSGLGSSDSAAVIGQSHWKSCYALWAEKKHRVDLSVDETVFLKKGRELEPLIASDYITATGRELIDLGPWTIRRSKRWPWMICTHDRLIKECDGQTGQGVLSAKAVLTRFGHARQQWEALLEAEGSDDAHAMQQLADQVRLDYQSQLQHEMIVSDLAWGDLAVWFPDRPTLIVHFDRNEPFCEYLIEEERRFWVDHVVGAVEPAVDGDASTTAAVKQLYGSATPGSSIVLDDSCLALVDVRVSLKQQIKDAEKQLEQVENELKQALGSVEEGQLSDGRTLRFQMRERAGYVVEPVKYRELRLQKAPKARRGR